MATNDSIDSKNDKRIELMPPPSCAPVISMHESKAVFTNGLATFVLIEELPAALRGSSGENQGEHQSAKVGKTLIPMPTRITVRTGDDLLEIEGQPIATTASLVQVPDVMQPLKGGLFKTTNDFFFVNDRPVVRGQ